jgi:hypothetical protein
MTLLSRVTQGQALSHTRVGATQFGRAPSARDSELHKYCNTNIHAVWFLALGVALCTQEGSANAITVGSRRLSHEISSL